MKSIRPPCDSFPLRNELGHGLYGLLQGQIGLLDLGGQGVAVLFGDPEDFVLNSLDHGKGGFEPPKHERQGDVPFQRVQDDASCDRKTMDYMNPSGYRLAR
jgi:hypothetical protein